MCPLIGSRQSRTLISLKWEAEQKNWLIKTATEKECSIYFLMSQVVREYIEREQTRLNFLEDGRKAIEHYDHTGLHVTHNEMRAWAENLIDTSDASPPLCHK